MMANEHLIRSSRSLLTEKCLLGIRYNMYRIPSRHFSVSKDMHQSHIYRQQNQTDEIVCPLFKSLVSVCICLYSFRNYNQAICRNTHTERSCMIHTKKFIHDSCMKGCIWNMYEICMKYTWKCPLSCMYKWDISYMNHIWIMYEKQYVSYMKHVWKVWTYHTWYMHESCVKSMKAR